MKNLFNLDFTLGIGFISFWIFIAITEVGELSLRTEPYSIRLPFAMAAMVITPFILGWFAGNKYKK